MRKKILVIVLFLIIFNFGLGQGFSLSIWSGVSASINSASSSTQRTYSVPTIKYPNIGGCLGVTKAKWNIKLGISSIGKGVDLVNKSQNASGGEKTVVKSTSTNELTLNIRLGKYTNRRNRMFLFLPFIGYDLRQIKHRNIAMLHISTIQLNGYLYHTDFSHCAILGCSLFYKFKDKHQVFCEGVCGYGLNKIITLDYLVYTNNQVYNSQVIHFGHYFMLSVGYEFGVRSMKKKNYITN